VNRAVLVGCLCLLLLVAGVTAPALASASNSGGPPVQLSAPENNSTTQHERPEDVSSDGSQADLRRWLQGRLSGALAESTIKLSQGQYEAADDVLGEEYESYFAKYVDVAGETDEADTAEEQALADAKSQQQEYVSLVQQYKSTYEKYQTARANGNETRARNLARKLQNLNEKLSKQSGSLEQTLREAGNTTDTNLSESTQRIHSITTNVSQRQENVTKETFVETSFTLTLQHSRGSYLQPLVIEGRLAANQNATLPDTATISVDGTLYTPQVGENGTFSLTYRPTTIPAGKQSLAIAYLPRAESVFLGSNALLNATIEPVTPTVHLRETQRAVSYADTLRISGAIVANETPVVGVPVDLSLGDVSLGTVQTTANGTYELETQVPAGVTDGDASLEATVAQENRAVAQSSTNTTIAVRETETRLSLKSTARAETIRLAGQLTAADGTPVSNQAITIVRNGTQISSVQTNGTGYFVATVPRPSNPARFSARFDGSSTNLASSGATETVEGTPVPSRGFPLHWVVGGVLLLGITLAGGGYAYRRRSRHGQDTKDPVTSTPATTMSEPQSSFQPDAAITELEGRGPSAEALTGLYGLTRHAIAESITDDLEASTHWEFYRAVAPELGDDEPELRRLTEAYEAVQYGAEGVTSESWQQLVEAAERLSDRTVFDGKAARDE
jgi:hypothetical protein